MEVVVGIGPEGRVGGAIRECGETAAISDAPVWVSGTGLWRLAERDCRTPCFLLGGGLLCSCERF